MPQIDDDEAEQHERDACARDRRLGRACRVLCSTCLRTGLPGRLRTTASRAASLAIAPAPDQRVRVGDEERGAERGDELEEHVAVEVHGVHRTAQRALGRSDPPGLKTMRNEDHDQREVERSGR